jgi:hypothetical protein
MKIIADVGHPVYYLTRAQEELTSIRLGRGSKKMVQMAIGLLALYLTSPVFQHET